MVKIQVDLCSLNGAHRFMSNQNSLVRHGRILRLIEPERLLVECDGNHRAVGSSMAERRRAEW